MQRDDRAERALRRRQSPRQTRARRDGIITRLLYGRIRRPDPGARAGARRAGPVPGRAVLDSSFLSLPGDRRSAGRSGWSSSTRSRLVLYAASATLGSIVGCLALYYVGREGRRRPGAQALQSGKRRPGAGGVSTLRRHGGADPVDSAAAGAVQDFRPAGGRRRDRRCQFVVGHRDRPWRRAISARVCSPCGTASRRLGSSASNGTVVSLVIVVVLVVALVPTSCGAKARQPDAANSHIMHTGSQLPACSDAPGRTDRTRSKLVARS